MKRRDIVIGLIVLVLLSGVIYFRQKSQKETPKVPEVQSTEKTLEEKFNIQIPEDVDKAELKDVSGGNSSGIATRDYKDSNFASSVIADLPEAGTGEFYQAWLVKNDGSTNVLLGNLRSTKGGWTVDYKSKTDYSDYGSAVVSLEKKSDKTLEKKILEGSF